MERRGNLPTIKTCRNAENNQSIEAKLLSIIERMINSPTLQLQTKIHHLTLGKAFVFVPLWYNFIPVAAQGLRYLKFCSDTNECGPLRG